MGKFDGRVAIITGGGKGGGIGYGLSTAFAKEGCNLVITGRNTKKLDDAKEELEELDKACAGRICFSSDRQAKEAGGRLTRLLCSACDEYHFDNTFAVGLLPGLQLVRGKHRNDLPPQEFLYWRTAFRRQVNRFVSECTSIVQALNSDADSVV